MCFVHLVASNAVMHMSVRLLARPEILYPIAVRVQMNILMMKMPVGKFGGLLLNA